MATDPGELARDALAQAQAANRQASRARLEAQFSGAPSAYQQAYDNVLPLVEFKQDMALTSIEEGDSVVRNQDIDAL